MNGGAGTDILDFTGTVGGDDVRIETVSFYENRTGNDYTGPAESWRPDSAGTIYVEMTQIEEIVVHGTDGDDTLVISGNFDGTALLNSTIFVDAGAGNDIAHF